MFTFLTPTPDAVSSSSISRKHAPKPRISVLAATLSGILLLSGCQQQTTPDSSDAAAKSSEQARVEDDKPAPKSDSAAARIEQFQPLYVAQMQGLQRRLQAEYESLQAADATNADAVSLLTEGTDSTADPTSNTSGDNGAVAPTNSSNDSSAAAGSDSQATNQDVAQNADQDASQDTDINISTEVGERDLEVLKRISLEPRQPEVLTEAQIIERYQQAMTALYQPATTPLNAEQTSTLLNIATLIPQLFEDTEIADRVVVKSPALARLVVQHQVWAQIEAQQALDMQQMKQAQQKEFEALMTKFNDTITDYDAQIAKYEATLKEFQ